MEYILPIEIWQEVINKTDAQTQIRLCQVSRLFYQNLRVTNLYDLDRDLLDKLDDEIIKRYPFVVKLNASYNRNIKNVSHMQFLKILKAEGNCGMSTSRFFSL